MTDNTLLLATEEMLAGWTGPIEVHWEEDDEPELAVWQRNATGGSGFFESAWTGRRFGFGATEEDLGKAQIFLDLTRPECRELKKRWENE